MANLICPFCHSCITKKAQIPGNNGMWFCYNCQDYFRPATAPAYFNPAEWPHKCPACNGPAYCGITPASKPDCRAKCEGSLTFPYRKP